MPASGSQAAVSNCGTKGVLGKSRSGLTSVRLIVAGSVRWYSASAAFIAPKPPDTTPPWPTLPLTPPIEVVAVCLPKAMPAACTSSSSVIGRPRPLASYIDTVSGSTPPTCIALAMQALSRSGWARPYAIALTPLLLTAEPLTTA